MRSSAAWRICQSGSVRAAASAASTSGPSNGGQREHGPAPDRGPVGAGGEDRRQPARVAERAQRGDGRLADERDRRARRPRRPARRRPGAGRASGPAHLAERPSRGLGDERVGVGERAPSSADERASGVSAGASSAARRRTAVAGSPAAALPRTAGVAGPPPLRTSAPRAAIRIRGSGCGRTTALELGAATGRERRARGGVAGRRARSRSGRDRLGSAATSRATGHHATCRYLPIPCPWDWLKTLSVPPSAPRRPLAVRARLSGVPRSR